MRIFKDQIKNYKSIAKKYNTVLNDKLSLQSVINSSIKELLDKDTDLTTIKKYNYYKTYEVKDDEKNEFEIDEELDKKFIFTDEELSGEGWTWTKDIKLDYEIWKKINDKFNLRALTTTQQDIVISNVVNTALSKAIDLKWRLRKETIDAWDNSDKNIDEDDEDIVSWKKQIIDENWSVDLVLIVLNKYKLIDNLKYGDNFVKITCPSCQHEDMAIFINSSAEKTSTVIDCFSGTCKLSGQIWEIFKDNEKECTTIQTVWNLFKNFDTVSAEKIKEYEGIKTNLSNGYVSSAAEKLYHNLIPSYNYLNKLGFNNSIQKDLEIGILNPTKKFNDREINNFLGRLCFPIFDKDGEFVGIQGRSMIEREKIDDFIDNEYIYKKLYWYNDSLTDKEKKEKKEKLAQKYLSTSGFKKSNHLYLLNKYAGRNIRKVVVVEGIKDAIRIYAQDYPNLAVVSSFGADLSDLQIDLLKDAFGINVMVIMGYDGDKAGISGNLKAAEKLSKAGFNNVRFVLLPRRNKSSYYKDWGEINAKQGTYSIILNAISQSVTQDNYVQKVKDREVEVISDNANNTTHKVVKKENDTISNAEQLVKPVAEAITFDANAERTADWFSRLIKLAEKEAGKFKIDIDAEVMSLQENGKEEWFKEFKRLYGELPYNILLIVARAEQKIKAREMLLAKLRKQTVSVVDDAADDNYIPF